MRSMEKLQRPPRAGDAIHSSLVGGRRALSREKSSSHATRVAGGWDGWTMVFDAMQGKKADEIDGIDDEIRQFGF